MYDVTNLKRPWVAKVEFPENARAEYQFGKWISGDGKPVPGDSGMLTIDAEKGDVIVTGQKNLSTEESNQVFHIVRNDEGQLDPCPKMDALKHYRTTKTNPLQKYPDAELIKELTGRGFNCTPVLASRKIS